MWILLLMLRLVKEWIKMKLVRGFVKILCYGWTDQRISLGIFLSFQLEKLFKLSSTRAAELARMMIGRSGNQQELGSQSFLKQEKFNDSNIQKTFKETFKETLKTFKETFKETFEETFKHSILLSKS